MTDFNGIEFKKKPEIYNITKGPAKGLSIFVWKEAEEYHIMDSRDGGGAFTLAHEDWPAYFEKMGLTKVELNQ